MRGAAQSQQHLTGESIAETKKQKTTHSKRFNTWEYERQTKFPATRAHESIHSFWPRFMIPSSRSIPGLGKGKSAEALGEDKALPPEDATFAGRGVPRALFWGRAADRVGITVCPSHAEKKRRETRG